MTPDSESRKVPPLNQIYFYLTEGCNCACRHCWIAPEYDPSVKYPTLPIELFERAIKEAKPLGLQGVKLTGGEPLMHPRFNELLEIIRREDLTLTLETNGMLCTPEVATEIARCPKRFVSVSIDGANAETHDWVRGVSGSFEHAIQGAKNLVDAGTRPQIIMTLMRRNVGQVQEMICMAEAIGASSVKFNIVQPTSRGLSLADDGETIGVEELIKLGRHIEMDLAPTTKLKLFFDYPFAFRPLSRIFAGDGWARCNILGIIGVIASGHYALCGIGYHIPEMVFGLVGKDRLDEVWKRNEVLNSLRAGLPDRLDGICVKCLMKHTCLGSCIAQNYYSTRNLWAPHWFCDQAYQEELFPKARVTEKLKIM